jgi:ABC-2 type transport system permease protein
MTATSPGAYASTVRERDPGFGATLASEWSKIISLRSTYITVGLGIVLAIGMTALVTAVIGATFDEWTPADQAAFDPVLVPFFGGVFSAILFIVFGVNAIATEYASKMMRLTLTVTPRRGRVLAAKLTLVGLVTLVAGTISTFAMYLTGQAIFQAFEMPTASLADGDVLRAVALVSLVSPLFPLIGSSLAFLFRSTAAPVTTALALLFAPLMFGPLLPRRWQEDVLAYLPGPASDSFAVGHLEPDNALYLSPGVGAAVTLVWLALFIGAAWFALTRRDA